MCSNELSSLIIAGKSFCRTTFTKFGWPQCPLGSLMIMITVMKMKFEDVDEYGDGDDENDEDEHQYEDVDDDAVDKSY